MWQLKILKNIWSDFVYTIRTVKILVKLLPSILALRKDRKKWINQEVSVNLYPEEWILIYII